MLRSPREQLRAAAALAALTLLGAAGCGGGASPGAAAPVASPGARLYLSNCVACHQPHGEGLRGVQPPLAGTPVAIGDAAQLLAWVMFGRRPAALPKGAYSGLMPQFGYLADEELAALLSYVRSNWGNAAAPVTAAMVARARAANRGD